MLCLMDSIRDDDPSVQYLLRVLEDAGSLTALILAAWQVSPCPGSPVSRNCSRRARSPAHRLASLPGVWGVRAE